jgi:hypothetical protein
MHSRSKEPFPVKLQEHKDELELLERQLKALQSGKQQQGTYGPLLSAGTGSKVAQDKLKKQIEEKQLQIKKLTAKK